MDKIKETIKEVLKENLTIEVNNWQFNADIILKFDGEVICKVKIDT